MPFLAHFSKVICDFAKKQALSLVVRLKWPSEDLNNKRPMSEKTKRTLKPYATPEFPALTYSDGAYRPITANAAINSNKSSPEIYFQLMRDLPDPSMLEIFHNELALREAFTKTDRNDQQRCIFIQGERGMGKTSLIVRFAKSMGFDSPKHMENLSVNCAQMPARDLIWETTFNASDTRRLSQIERAFFDGKLLNHHKLQIQELAGEKAIDHDAQSINWNLAIDNNRERDGKDSILPADKRFEQLIDSIDKELGLSKSSEGFSIQEKPGIILRCYRMGMPCLLDELNRIDGDLSMLNRVINTINGKERVDLTLTSKSGEKFVISPVSKDPENHFMILAAGNKGDEGAGAFDAALSDRFFTIQPPAAGADSIAQRICQTLTGLPLNGLMEMVDEDGNNISPLAKLDNFTLSEKLETLRTAMLGKTEAPPSAMESRLLQNAQEVVEGANRLGKFMAQAQSLMKEAASIDPDLEHIQFGVRMTLDVINESMMLPRAASTEIDANKAFPSNFEMAFDMASPAEPPPLTGLGGRIAQSLYRRIDNIGFSEQTADARNRLIDLIAETGIAEPARAQDVPSVFRDNYLDKVWEFPETLMTASKEAIELAEGIKEAIVLKEKINSKKNAKKSLEAIAKKITVTPEEVQRQLSIAKRLVAKDRVAMPDLDSWKSDGAFIKLYDLKPFESVELDKMLNQQELETLMQSPAAREALLKTGNFQISEHLEAIKKDKSLNAYLSVFAEDQGEDIDAMLDALTDTLSKSNALAIYTNCSGEKTLNLILPPVSENGGWILINKEKPQTMEQAAAAGKPLESAIPFSSKKGWMQVTMEQASRYAPECVDYLYKADAEIEPIIQEGRIRPHTESLVELNTRSEAAFVSMNDFSMAANMLDVTSNVIDRHFQERGKHSMQRSDANLEI